MKKGYIGLVGFITMLVFSACSTATINKELLDKVDSVSIRDGNTGELTEIKDSEEMSKIATYLESLELTETTKPISGGYTYYMDLYSGDEASHRITFMEDAIEIDDTYYKIDANNNKTSIVELVTSF